MLSLLLLHYWKETTDRGRRQQRGDILASWKGGSVFEREHLAPLTPGKRVKVINICVSVTRKLWKAFPEVWPCAPGWFPWCRAVLFGSLQGVVASFPLWVDPGTVSGTEGHQKPQHFDYVELSLSRSNPTVPKQQAGIDDVAMVTPAEQETSPVPCCGAGIFWAGRIVWFALVRWLFRSQDWLSGNENTSRRGKAYMKASRNLCLCEIHPYSSKIRWMCGLSGDFLVSLAWLL